MEGTLEDPLVKDPTSDDPASLVKDILISNGVNGDLADHADDLGEYSGASEKGDTEEEEEEDEEGETKNETGNNENEEEEEEEEEEHRDDELTELPEKEYEDGAEHCGVTSEREEEDEKTTAEQDEYEDEGNEEECDGAASEAKISELSDCASEENNVVSAVSPKSHTTETAKADDEEEAEEEEEEVEAVTTAASEEPAEESAAVEIVDEDDDNEVVETNEPMEVDVRSDNSDVECLDEGVVQINPINISDENATDSDVKNISGSSDDVLPIYDSDMDISDMIEVAGRTKSNGHNAAPQQERPSKDPPKVKKPRKQIDLSSITPRRSSRNIKRTSYIEKEPEEVEDGSSDIEEIKPEDPLACIVDSSKDKENSKLKSPIRSGKTTIVVSDTKRLVEIAAGSKCSKGGKKEPTLVIIDTNSILSGRGGIPVSSSSTSGSSGSTIYGSKSSHHHHHQQQQQHHHQSQHQQHHHHPITSSNAFSVMHMGQTQTMYPNMRTTITPVPMLSRSQQGQKTSGGSVTVTQPSATPQILPTLTDDMFVVEAPSFIVPYVYEKPPLKPLKDFVEKLEKSIAEVEKEEEEERKRKKKLRMEEKQKKNESITEVAADDDDDEDDDDDGKDEKSISSKNDHKSGDDDEDEDSDGDNGKKKTDTDSEMVDLTEKGGEDKSDEKSKVTTYFDLPLGKFFMQIGVNLVQEFVQTDLLRTQKRKQGKHGTASAETQIAINSLIKNLEFSKENNEPFHLEMKKCEFCSFKTESALVMQHHLETPHMKNYAYKCNFCPLEVRSPHDILFHMEAEHNTRGRLERGPAFHQCPNCPFEDNQKGKLTRHILACAKKFRPDRNLEPASDWEPPAKIPRLHRPRQVAPVNASALAMAMGAKGTQPLLPKLLPAPLMGRGRGRPPMQPRYSDIKSLRPGSGTTIRQDNVASMIYRPTSSGLLVPTSYQFGSNQIFQVVGGSGTVTSGVTGVSSGSSVNSGRPTPIALVSNIIDSQSRLSSSPSQNSASSKNPAAKLLSQPSISITPLPRTTSQTPISGSGSSSKPGGKNTFVICEICDGYIKDLEQLRNHMQWIHKVKIHPKMIYNRPPLNCQKCQFRFFTDQGLERHLLGSHGLVTSSMQEAANKGKDAGRCPACGRVYQWKLLNHVARDHGMTLKPAHLSYKCTVCTATFGMYKQFENHVYSAHSVVAKKVMDKNKAPSSPSSRSNDSLLKPLKINDEITIIPQPAKSSTRGSQGRGK